MDLNALINPKVWESPAKLIVGILLALTVFREWRGGYFKNFQNYLKTLSFKPYSFILLTFLPVFLFAFSQDLPGIRKAQELSGVLWSSVLWTGRNIGENVKFWYLVFGIYGLARLCRSKDWSSRAFGALVSSSLSGLIAHLLKFVFMRARPYAEAGPYSFFNYDEIFRQSRAHQSLPSGDVALVSAATAYFFFSIRNPAVRLIILFFPLANAYARMGLNKHWPSDTVLAMGLGFSAAWFFSSFKEYQTKKGEQPQA